jgi:hypothetical protein
MAPGGRRRAIPGVRTCLTCQGGRDRPSRSVHPAGQRGQSAAVITSTSTLPLVGQGYGTHSLRRNKASIIYKATGNLRAVQILLGRAKIESTFAASAWNSKTLLSSRRERKFPAPDTH